MAGRFSKRPFSPAEKSGLLALAAAAALAFVDVHWSVLPLALFVGLSLTAPFVPHFGFFLPIVSRGRSGKQAVAVTFDDGPDPLSTPALLALLERYRFKATFFVAGEKAAAYPGLIRDMIRQGHSVGNHTYSHDPLILLKGSRRLSDEIEATQKVLRDLGITALAFRPPVGVTSPLLPGVLNRLNLFAVNFSCRGYDLGNRRLSRLAERILKRVRPDDIVLLHDAGLCDSRRLAYWLDQVEKIFAGVDRKGFAVLPLAELIGRPVMEISQEHFKLEHDNGR